MTTTRTQATARMEAVRDRVTAAARAQTAATRYYLR
jgi:hypothetical protein